jgi:hypothetical protein
VLRLHPRKLRLLARGLVRPVAAINWHGAIVVADEYANAVWRVDRHGHHTKLASVPLPDDLAVVSGHLVANSLAGAVWDRAPLAPRGLSLINRCAAPRWATAGSPR